MTPYESLREEINKLMPERLKLEFGVEVLAMHNDTGNQFFDRINSQRQLSFEQTKYEKLPEWYAGSYFIEHGYLQANDRHILGRRDAGNIFRLVSVLGNPLTIADVLVALEKTKEENHSFGLFSDGSLFNSDISTHDAIARFNLTSPLSDHSNQDACVAVLKLLKE